MMGPAAYSKSYRPGTVVKTRIKDHSKKTIGTIIENFVDFNIKTGYRVEKALVMWTDGSSDWISTQDLTIVSSD